MDGGPRMSRRFSTGKHQRHAYLHRTLRAWADTYRDGARGKERIVVEYAMARPDTATGQDDFVTRMLWALERPKWSTRHAVRGPEPSGFARLA